VYALQEGLGKVAVWCIGEYGEMLVNNTNELDGEEPLVVSFSHCKLLNWSYTW
jgi:AP-1 complex subunit gamma-1